VFCCPSNLPAAGTPDVNYTRELAINIGAGPVIPLLSGGGGRGNIMHPALKRLLADIDHHVQRQHDLAYDEVEQEIGGSE